MFDVVIVGGGPAGLSAALVLGRCRRQVLVCDSGRYRNASSRSMHGFLTRDGTPPAELLRLARAELDRYETVEHRFCEAIDATARDGRFEVTLKDGTRVEGRKLLLATGVTDELPAVEGVTELYGRSVFHCPYCDGWEVRDQPLAIYGRGDDKGAGLALEMTIWSRDLVLCTDGPSELTPPVSAQLSRFGIPVREERVARLEGRDGILDRVIFEGGEALARRALFFNTGLRLGCELDDRGCVKAGRFETTNVAGVYVAGDASREVLQVIVAAGEGAEAAYAINTSLLKEDLRAGTPA
jgi:thioredoxin reductase